VDAWCEEAFTEEGCDKVLIEEWWEEVLAE
jgi:hypothetical protein